MYNQEQALEIARKLRAGEKVVIPKHFIIKEDEPKENED